MRRLGVYRSTSEQLGQVRRLKIARTGFGFYYARHGRKRYPPWRQPYNHMRNSGQCFAPYFWTYHTTKTPQEFLPQQNYITGDWTGTLHSHNSQVYTLQHAVSGAMVRMRRFPSTTNLVPSRWMIGKPLRTLTHPHMHLIDEGILTKKMKLEYIKKGLLPKGS